MQPLLNPPHRPHHRTVSRPLSRAGTADHFTALLDHSGPLSVQLAGQHHWAVYSISVSQGVVAVVIGIRKAGDKRDMCRVAVKRLSKD